MRGQTSILTNVKGLTAILSRDGGGRWPHLSTLPMPRSRLLVSPRKEPVHMFGSLGFVAAAQEMPPAHPDLVASRAHGFSGMVANKERVQNYYSRAQYRRIRQTPTSVFH